MVLVGLLVLGLTPELSPCNEVQFAGPPHQAGVTFAGTPLLRAGGGAQTVERLYERRTFQVRPWRGPELDSDSRYVEVTVPLPPGDYVFDGTFDRPFTIVSTGTPGAVDVHRVPDPGLTTDVRTVVDEHGGCPTSSVTLTLGNREAVATDAFLVSITTPSREIRRLLSPVGSPRLVLDADVDLETTKLCFTVAGVARTGSVGATLDLGCIDPLDPQDARFVYRPAGRAIDSAGCTVGAPGGLLTCGVLLFIWKARRRRPRP